MKLSEAIREGAKRTPHNFGQYLYKGATCALGAAMVGIGMSTKARDASLAVFSDKLRTNYGPLLNPDCTCPVGVCQFRASTWLLIAHLNDHHEWTREQIADWVEQFEAANV